jgi:hypothetical protein
MNQKRSRLLVLTLTGHDMVFVNGVPRGGDQYRYGWMHLPVVLKKGKNEFYARVARFGRFGGITANLTFPAKPVYLNTEDLTVSDIVPGLKNDSLWIGLVVQNVTSKVLTGLQIKSVLSGKEVVTNVPTVPAMSSRKVGVLINGAGINASGKQDVAVTLTQAGKAIDQVENRDTSLWRKGSSIAALL